VTLELIYHYPSRDDLRDRLRRPLESKLSRAPESGWILIEIHSRKVGSLRPHTLERKASYTSSLRPHTLERKASYTSSLRPHTLIELHSRKVRARAVDACADGTSGLRRHTLAA
jgi:hypothetical protein